ncbi:MAG: EthD domain-containing protein [Dehalococcoidia bacterium]
MITMIVYVRRKKGITREQFSKYWFEHHGPLVLSTPEFMKYVRKYIQYHFAPGDAQAGSLFGDIVDYDGCGVIWFDSREAMNAALNEPRYLEIMRPDEHNFIDLEGCLSFVGDERVIYVDKKCKDRWNV